MPRGTANAAVRMTSQKEPVTKLIRKTRQATRRRYSPDEKIRIVMEGIRGDEPVSALCRRDVNGAAGSRELHHQRGATSPKGLRRIPDNRRHRPRRRGTNQTPTPGP